MNRQGTPIRPTGGIEWTHILGPQTGFTSNPVKGCKHECRWKMPDGNIAICYAKSVKERMSGVGSFEKITWHPEELNEIRSHKAPAGIFIDSMSDLFGLQVQKDWIDAVIQCIADCKQHVFFSLTKNPSRFREFKHDAKWPANWLVGISYPPTWMYGRQLTMEQQRTWFEKGLGFLVESPAQWRWVSAEPLSLDLSDHIAVYQHLLHWIVIGAASNGTQLYQPDREVFAKTLQAATNLPIFFKGNISHDLANQVAGGWKEEFPAIVPKRMEQVEMI